MRILTDIDEVCLQLSDALQAFLATKGHHTPERMRDHHNIPDLFDITIPETLAYVRDFHRSPAFGTLLPEPCAAAVLPDLHRRGHTFVAVTACLNEPDVVARRTRNLEETFGFRWEAIHCIGLSLNKAPVLQTYAPSVWVEDMWHHAVTGAALGHRTFLIDRKYNRDHTQADITRVHDWHEIARRLA